VYFAGLLRGNTQIIFLSAGNEARLFATVPTGPRCGKQNIILSPDFGWKEKNLIFSSNKKSRITREVKFFLGRLHTFIGPRSPVGRVEV
jgi:hypothetical protein